MLSRRLAIVLLIVGLSTAGIWTVMGAAPPIEKPPAAKQPAAKPAAESAATLEQLCSGKLKIVDLSWPLNDRGAYWPGENYKPFELRTIATLQRDGVLSKSFCMPEHQGTHLDAPNHFDAAGRSVDQIDPQDLFAPGVVIDVTRQAAADADYRFSLEALRAWEKEHGPIPGRAVVLLRTGWGKQFWNPTRYRNQDDKGTMHFPGYAADAVEFLLADRQVRGIGIDTLSIDYGPSRDFVVHHLLGRAGRYGLENLAELEKLPERGFFLCVAPIKIETGSGGPARVLAILP